MHAVIVFLAANIARFLALAFLFSLPAIAVPGIASQRLMRRGMLTDFFYYLAIPIYAAQIQGRAKGFLLAFVFSLSPLKSPIPSIGSLPRWLQFLIVAMVVDFTSYWLHRAMHHQTTLWRFHAVHHSSKELDRASGLRFHPINITLTDTIPIVLALSLSPKASVFAAFSLTLWLIAMFEHVNVNWNWGPLRFVIVSPAFHRWHHTHSNEGGNRNFAGLFPFLDVLFGTFYMPRGKYPEVFGTDDDDVPTHVLGQLAYPFVPQRYRGRVVDERLVPVSAAGIEPR